MLGPPGRVPEPRSPGLLAPPGAGQPAPPPAVEPLRAVGPHPAVERAAPELPAAAVGQRVGLLGELTDEVAPLAGTQVDASLRSP